MDKTVDVKRGCEQVIKNIYQCYDKPVIDNDYIQEKLTHYTKLISKLPVHLKPFQSLVDIVLQCNDDYRIVWLGNKLHHIYLGKHCSAHLPYLWEDEVDLETICQTLLK